MEYQALLGPLPDNLAASPNLRTLGIGFNNFAGGVPSSIGASESLRDVTLMAANLSGSLPYFSGLLLPFSNIFIWGTVRDRRNNAPLCKAEVNLSSAELVRRFAMLESKYQAA